MAVLPKTSLSMALDDVRLLSLCGDGDGCTLLLGARSSRRGGDWLPAFRAARTCHWSIETDPLGASGRYWSLDDACAQAMAIPGAGIDGNGTQDTVARAWGSTCNVADYPRVGAGYGPDDATGFSLFYYDDTGNEDVEMDFACVLVVQD